MLGSSHPSVYGARTKWDRTVPAAARNGFPNIYEGATSTVKSRIWEFSWEIPQNALTANRCESCPPLGNWGLGKKREYHLVNIAILARSNNPRLPLILPNQVFCLITIVWSPFKVPLISTGFFPT